MADNDEVLLGKINAAVAEHNAAEQAVTTARVRVGVQIEDSRPPIAGGKQTSSQGRRL